MSATQPFVSNGVNIQGRRLRVLMAENEPPRISKMLRALFPDEESALQLTLVSTISILLPTIQLVGPEILFLELSTAGQDALATVRAVHRAAPSLPLITLVNASEKQMAEESLQEGALDFVLKDVADEKTLERVLRAALERNTVSGLADLLRDPDTGVYNSDGFRALAAKYVQAAQRTGGQLVLLSVQIQNLEKLGTEFGPSAPESAVKDTVDLLKGSFRRTDLLARLGAGEFVILAADAAEPSVAIIRQRLENKRVALNREREPWGAIEFAVNVIFWSARKNRSFGEIADSIIGRISEANDSDKLEVDTRMEC